MVNISQLDVTDLAILREVQADGRVSIVDLAERVNLTKSPCLKRLRRLERDGFIASYHAILDAEKIEQAISFFVQVKLESTTSKNLEAFNAAVRAEPQILGCHMLSGGYDYLLKVRTKDMHAYRELLGEVISDLPGVYQTSTFPVMEEVKDSSLLVVG